MSNEPLYNEPWLVQEMQAGSEDAFTTLYRHYSPQLYINILKMIRDPALAEEMVQELFTRIWQKRESNSITESFAGYVYKAAQNLVHDFFRKVQRDRLLMERFRALTGEYYEHIEETFDHQQLSVVLKNAIDQLSPQQKKVYELVKIEGCTYRKAAEIMGISAFTIKEYLVSANKSIRSYISGHTDTALVLLLFIATCSMF
ncbi:MAG: sigma-70 family RNA polymerase sigma factor [Bacteroidota bacterium]|nr:sigma-70 family RNA polymerase sigma factor [Bacteroidota bacterium]